jgi:hypothetical protein
VVLLFKFLAFPGESCGEGRLIIKKTITPMKVKAKYRMGGEEYIPYSLGLNQLGRVCSRQKLLSRKHLLPHLIPARPHSQFFNSE